MRWRYRDIVGVMAFDVKSTWRRNHLAVDAVFSASYGRDGDRVTRRGSRSP